MNVSLDNSRVFFISHISVKFDKIDLFLSYVPRKTAEWTEILHFLEFQKSLTLLKEK